MNEMSVADVLRGAIDVLAERGWHQGGYVSADGAVCSAGALNVATGQEAGGVLLRPNGLRAARALAAEFGGTAWDLAAWNDDPSRTYEDVVLAFKHAAAAAEAVL